MTSKETIRTTAPIRALRGLIGLRWSGEVTGSFPATFGPSLVGALRGCILAYPSRPIGPARLDSWRARSGSFDGSEPDVWEPMCGRGSCGAADGYRACEPADRHPG